MTTIKIRRGTAALWTSTNPVLASGEMGYETDTRKLKVGDASSRWAALPYVVGGEIDGALIADGTLTLAKTAEIAPAAPGGDNGLMVCNDGVEFELLSSTAHSPGDVPTLQGDLTVAWAAPSGGSGLTSPQVLARGLGC